MYFLDHLKGKKSEMFLLDQRLKNIFINNFSMWVKVYIGRGYMDLVDFIDWLGFC